MISIAVVIKNTMTIENLDEKIHVEDKHKQSEIANSSETGGI